MDGEVVVRHDDDGSGTINISELADFIEHGTATFHADGDGSVDLSMRKQGTVDLPPPCNNSPKASASIEPSETIFGDVSTGDSESPLVGNQKNLR